MSDVDKIYGVFAQRDAAASNSFTLHKGSRFIGNVTFKLTKGLKGSAFMRTTCYLHLFDDRPIKAVADESRRTAQSSAIHRALLMLSAAECIANKELVDELLIGFDHNEGWIANFEDKGILVAHIRGRY